MATNNAQLGNAIGNLLFSHGGGQGDAYWKTLGQGARAYEAMAAARTNRAKALIEESMLSHRQALPTSLGGVYSDPAQAAMIGDLVLSSNTPDLRSAGNLASPGAAEAFARLGDAATAGNRMDMNNAISQITLKPRDAVDIKGGTLYAPDVPLGDQVLRATPEAQARIGAAEALAWRRHNQPLTAGGAGKPAKPTTLTKPMRDALSVVLSGNGDGSAFDSLGAPQVDANRSRQRLTSFLQSHPTGGTELDALQWAQQHAPLDGAALPEGQPFSANFPGHDGPVSALGDTVQLANAPSDDDPRVQALLQQASDAVNKHGADRAKVEARLRQEFAKLGYRPQAVSGGG